jgi:hypothetical protein
MNLETQQVPTPADEDFAAAFAKFSKPEDSPRGVRLLRLMEGGMSQELQLNLLLAANLLLLWR